MAAEYSAGVAYSVVGGAAGRGPGGARRSAGCARSEVERAAAALGLPLTWFSPQLPDLYTTTWVATLVLLVGLVLLYNVRTRALHRHAPYLDMYEWLLWTGISVFGLILVAASSTST